MTHVELKQKVIRESSARPRGMGPYAVFSFLMKYITDANKARAFMEKEGYTKTEISNVLTQRKRDISSQKSQKNRGLL